MSERISLHKQEIWLDVYDPTVEKIAEKKISSYRSEELLNHWVKRPHKIKKFPPMSSALKVGYENKARCDVIAENFLAGLISKGNDFSNQNGTAFLSGSYVSNHGMSVTPENFEQCMIIHMVRKISKATWINNKD